MVPVNPSELLQIVGPAPEDFLAREVGGIGEISVLLGGSDGGFRVLAIGDGGGARVLEEVGVGMRRRRREKVQVGLGGRGRRRRR